MTNCLFCDIAADAKLRNTIYEDGEIVAFLDIHPINPGHTLIIPRKHSTDIYDTPKSTLARIAQLSKDISLKLKKSMGADGISILQMNEKDGDQEIMHYHLHVIPRTRGDWFHRDVIAKASALQKEIRPNNDNLTGLQPS